MLDIWNIYKKGLIEPYMLHVLKKHKQGALENSEYLNTIRREIRKYISKEDYEKFDNKLKENFLQKRLTKMQTIDRKLLDSVNGEATFP
jgi:Fe-S cluster biosynthesis and repair protein YggX